MITYFRLPLFFPLMPHTTARQKANGTHNQGPHRCQLNVGSWGAIYALKKKTPFAILK